MFSFPCPGLVNVTVNCCIWNELMFKKDSVISANAYRCEVVVCEEKVKRVVYNSLKPNFGLVEKWSWCRDCLQAPGLYRGQANVRMLPKGWII